MEIGRTDNISGAGGIESRRIQKTGKPSEASPAKKSEDSVEISDAAKYISQLLSSTDNRSEKIDRVRKEVESGVYESDEKLKSAINRLIDEEDMSAE